MNDRNRLDGETAQLIASLFVLFVLLAAIGGFVIGRMTA